MKELFKIEDKTKTKMKWWNCDCLEKNDFVKHVSINGRMVDISLTCDNCGSEYVFELPFSELIKFCGYLQEEASK